VDDLLRHPLCAQRGRAAEALRPRIVTAFVAALVALGGCDGGEDEGTPAAGTEGEAGQGGALVWALERKPRTIDPLLAEERAEQLVSRQIYEPLVEDLARPFDDPGRVRGLALSARPSDDATLWRLRIRRGVRFADGAPLDSRAVLDNADRWLAHPAGRRLLGDAFEVDAPRPGLVRFLLRARDRRFDERLASPRLGIVSPQALRSDPSLPVRQPGGGTGAFELRERDPSRLLLARNTGWWGTAHGLGPALDQLHFVVVSDSEERFDLLADGEVQAAERLGPAMVRALRRDPLLSSLPSVGGTSLGLERSVRGVASGREIPSLQAAWLTTIGSG
jgi:peptide/nickel transport system substrate-binding protein